MGLNKEFRKEKKYIIIILLKILFLRIVKKRIGEKKKLEDDLVMGVKLKRKKRVIWIDFYDIFNKWINDGIEFIG